MPGPFMQRLCDLVTSSAPRAPDALAYVRPALEDTLAVIHAGWGEPVTRRVQSLYAGSERLQPDSDLGALGPEAAALVLGSAAHALDFDDVHMTSATHPSAVLVPALLAGRLAAPEQDARLVSAFGVGLAANVALGRVLGFAHYDKGWHATSTIGPLAAAAALAHLFGLERDATAHAVALAAAQAGGLQRNFGAMAKPLHAGLAAAAGVRAALLARAGVTADEDIFGPKGYFDLYGGEAPAEPPQDVHFDIAGGGISMKLYPCCYLAHRPIAAALEARQALERAGVAPETLHDVEVVGPPGGFVALRVERPRTGSEGKFCGAYAVACALTDGAVTLAHFEDEALARKDVWSLFERTRLRERPRGGGDEASIHGGEVELTARDSAGAVVAHTRCRAFPGSPESPPTPAQLEAKVRDCLAHYGRRTGAQRDYEAFRQGLDALLAPAAAAGGEGRRAAGD